MFQTPLQTPLPTPSQMPEAHQESTLVSRARNILSHSLFPAMPLARFFTALVILTAAAQSSWAVNCVTQSAMPAADRTAILAAANTLAGAIAAPNLDKLQSSLLPAEIPDWESIRGVAQSASPLLKGGQVAWGDGYLLDATDLKGPADSQFFCTNADSAVTITISLHNLPPGRFALLIGDAEGAPQAGQLALILGADTTAGGSWKLGGLFAREGVLDGHDGIWYWRRGRDLSQKKALWSAWFSYDAARWLLLPVDFLSSPHLEKLNHEQSQIGPNPVDSFPLTVSATGAADAGKSWRITGMRLDTTLHTDDLALTYESTGLSDPQAARAEAVAVMSSLLKLHPDLRDSFHGLWAYAEKDGRQSYAIELAMHDIP